MYVQSCIYTCIKNVLYNYIDVSTNECWTVLRAHSKKGAKLLNGSQLFQPRWLLSRKVIVISDLALGSRLQNLPHLLPSQVPSQELWSDWLYDHLRWRRWNWSHRFQRN